MRSVVILILLFLVFALSDVCAVPGPMYESPCDSHKDRRGCFSRMDCAYCDATGQCVTWDACENTPSGKHELSGCGDANATDYAAHSGWQLPHGYTKCAYYRFVLILAYCLLVCIGLAPLAGLAYCFAAGVLYLFNRHCSVCGGDDDDDAPSARRSINSKSSYHEIP
jgi:hypothetical protein